MKNLIIALLSLASVNALAHEIKGTLMLNGSLKTKISVMGANTTCKIKVLEVKNLREEDHFGNPGYKADLLISLSGKDRARSIKIKFEKEVQVNNMHVVNGVKMVKDFDYYSSADRVSLTIDVAGRIRNVSIPYGGQTVKCNF